MTLPWIVILAAFAFFVVWKTGLFEHRQTPRPPRSPRLEISEKSGQDRDRLKVFEEFLRDLGDEDKAERPPKGQGPGDKTG